MTCTYDLSTEIGKVRLAIGDTVCASAQLSDEEITALLEQSGSWQEGALRAVDTLIALYATSSYDIRLGPRAESRSQRLVNLQMLRQHLTETFGLAGVLRSALESEALTFGWTTVADEDDYSGLMT